MLSLPVHPGKARTEEAWGASSVVDLLFPFYNKGKGNGDCAELLQSDSDRWETVALLGEVPGQVGTKTFPLPQPHLLLSLLPPCSLSPGWEAP